MAGQRSVLLSPGNYFFPVYFWKPIHLRAEWGIANLLTHCTQMDHISVWKHEVRVLVSIHLLGCLHPKKGLSGVNVKKLQALFPPYSKPQCTASTRSPYEVISHRPVLQPIHHYVTTCLHPYMHIHSLHGKKLDVLTQGATEKLRLLLSLVSCRPGSLRQLQEPDVHPSTSPEQPCLTCWERRCLRGLSEMQI